MTKHFHPSFHFSLSPANQIGGFGYIESRDLDVFYVTPWDTLDLIQGRLKKNKKTAFSPILEKVLKTLGCPKWNRLYEQEELLTPASLQQRRVSYLAGILEAQFKHWTLYSPKSLLTLELSNSLINESLSRCLLYPLHQEMNSLVLRPGKGLAKSSL